MKRLIIPVILFLTITFISSYSHKTNAQTVDFAVEVVGPFDLAIDATKVKIIGPLDLAIGAEKWKVVGGCSNRPNLKIQIARPIDFFMATTKKVEIIGPLETFLAIGAKKVCITNPNALDYETLKLLRLVN